MTSAAHPHSSFIISLRSMALDIAFVWLIISFVRLFIVENNRIPTSSMTPTLVGGVVAELDVNGDGLKDMVLSNRGQYEVFINTGAGWMPDMPWSPPPNLEREIIARLKGRYDNVLVNKFCYWFHKPERGDVAVFKPPRNEFKRTAPIFVKRVVGLPDETVSVGADHRLWINGARVDSPGFFKNQYYESVQHMFSYASVWSLKKNQYMFFGDNTLNSSDGRFWGGTPRSNIRGKVVLRYWPFPLARIH